MKIVIPSQHLPVAINRAQRSVNLVKLTEFNNGKNFSTIYSVCITQETIDRLTYGLIEYLHLHDNEFHLRRALGVKWEDVIHLAVKYHFAKIVWFSQRAQDSLGYVEWFKFTRLFPEAMPNWHCLFLEALAQRTQVMVIKEIGTFQTKTVLSGESIEQFYINPDDDVKSWISNDFAATPQLMSVFENLKKIHNEFNFRQPNLPESGVQPFCIGDVYRSTSKFESNYYVLDAEGVNTASLLVNVALGTQCYDMKFQDLNTSTIYNDCGICSPSHKHGETMNIILWGVSYPKAWRLSMDDIVDGGGGANAPIPPGSGDPNISPNSGDPDNPNEGKPSSSGPSKGPNPDSSGLTKDKDRSGSSSKPSGSGPGFKRPMIPDSPSLKRGQSQIAKASYSSTHNLADKITMGEFESVMDISPTITLEAAKQIADNPGIVRKLLNGAWVGVNSPIAQTLFKTVVGAMIESRRYRNVNVQREGGYAKIKVGPAEIGMESSNTKTRYLEN